MLTRLTMLTILTEHLSIVRSRAEGGLGVFFLVQGAVLLSKIGWPFVQLLEIHLFSHNDDDGDDDYYAEYICSNWCLPCLSAWRSLANGWAGVACQPRMEYCKWRSTCFLRSCPSGVHGAVWVPSPLAGQLVDGHAATEAEQRPQSGRGGRQGSWCTRTIPPSDKLVRFLPPDLIFVRAVMVWG